MKIWKYRDAVGRWWLLAALVLSTLCLTVASQTPSSAPQAPVVEKIPKALTNLGHTRIDDYYWLNERDNPKVLDYLKAENAYTKAVMAPTEPLQQKLYDEIVGRIKQTDMSVPYRANGYYYYTRFEEGKEYPVYCRKKGSLAAKEEVMLNVNEMAKGHAFFSVTGLAVSPDNKLLAYGVDTVSRRQYTLHFKNLITGATHPDAIPITTGGAAWAADNKTVFYTVKDAALRPFKIFRHTLGAEAARDPLVFHEMDETYTTGVKLSKSRQYLFIISSSTLSTEYRFLDAKNPQEMFRVFQPRRRDLLYNVEHFRDRFYIHTNDQAKNFRLMVTPVDRTERENWREVIAHRDDVLLQEFELFKDFLVLQERKNGLTQLRVIPWKGKVEHYLDFGEAAYLAAIGTNPEFDTPLLRYSYTSLTTPNSIYDYDMPTRARKLLKQEEVLGKFNPTDYQAERLYATAGDGVKVPISLVYKKGLVKSSENPLLLYGYGSYGASMEPTFSSVRLSLLDRGFVYAIAHIRGGQEMGRWWYEDGKLLKKKNTFTDFIACAEYLIAEKFTNPHLLFASGGSAGGLLMGAVVNLRPDLFRGVVAAVPFVDVITTMLDTSIPLTTEEFDEWGNPAQKEFYDYILSYSPYDNVTAKDYPALFVTTGLHDSQVQYWEPAKWVARLRVLKTDHNPLLLYCNMEAGHGGASGRFQRFKEIAMQFAFILDQLGIRE